MSNHNNLTEIWDVYQNTLQKTVVSEAAGTGPVGTQGPIPAKSRKSRGKALPGMEGGTKNFGTKPGSGAKVTNSKDVHGFQNDKTSNVEEVDGYEAALDPKTMKKKGLEDNVYGVGVNSSQQFDEKIRKSYLEDINNNMKSVFDKLFEEVMGSEEASEMEALGIDVDVDETEAAGTDEVTITLDKDMAKKLCDLLQAAMGEDEDDDAEDMEHEDYEEMEEDVAEEAYVDAEPKPLADTTAHMTKVAAGSNKVKSTVTSKANSKKADGKAGGKVDGELEPVADAVPHLTKVAAGSNKVHSTVTSKPGVDATA